MPVSTLEDVTKIKEKVVAGLVLGASLFLLTPSHSTSGSPRTDRPVTESGSSEHSRGSSWQIDYARPEDVSTLTLMLCYKTWDSSVEGDVPTTQILLKTRVKFTGTPGKIPIVIFLGADKSTLTIQGRSIPGKGFRLDPSFTPAAEPKPNYDGTYVLAQKPVDAKNPAAMGDVQNASAWIELGIIPQP